MSNGINIIILFDHLHMISNIAGLLGSISSEVNIIKLVDIQQLVVISEDKDQEKEQKILITEWDVIDQFEDCDINIELFSKIFIIDDIEKPELISSNFIYINHSLFYTKLEIEYIKVIKESVNDIEYIPIKWPQIKNEKYPNDFYLKINKEKFIKLINKETEITNETRESFKEKGITSLYINNVDWKVFLLYLEEENTKKNLQGPSSKNALYLADSTEAIHNYIKELGFDEKIVRKTVQLQKNIEEQYNNKMIHSLLNKFKNQEGTYIYNHSFLTAVLCLEVSKQISWMSEENKEKIYIASMFHDLGYKNPENAIYEDLNLSDVNNLPTEIKDDVLSHTKFLSSYIKDIRVIHPDVIRMISEHHGIHGMESYPRQVYPTEVNLVFALFAISHEFSIELNKINFEVKLINTAIENINQKFSKGIYKRVLSEFVEVISVMFLVK